MTSNTRTLRSKTLRLTAIGVAATGLCVVGAGMAAAANPTSAFGQAVGTTVNAVGVDWSDLPAGYTQAQYEAFWAAEYSGEDLVELQELWSLDETETKSRAGQMLLDGFTELVKRQSGWVEMLRRTSWWPDRMPRIHARPAPKAAVECVPPRARCDTGTRCCFYRAPAVAL